ncbi:unnamed protein product, partial [Symbiodinium microadriaticum]
MDMVSTVLGDVITAAVEETEGSSADTASSALYTQWKECVKAGGAMHRAARALLSSTSPVDSAEAQVLQVQSDACIHNAFLRWRAWEKDLLNLATESFTQKKLSQQADNSELTAFLVQRTPKAEKAQRASLEIQEMEEQLEVAREALASSEVDALRNAVEDLQERVD